jgi:hypothetical protein
MRIELEKRAEPRPCSSMTFLSPLIALALTGGDQRALFALLGKDPLRRSTSSSSSR